MDNVNISLLEISEQNRCIQTNVIIQQLLSYGFRPDGIAYLLVMLGECFCSGKI